MSEKEIILEIVKLCMEKNSRKKNTIFFEYYGHCNLFRIEVDKDGWVKNIEPDFKREVYMDIGKNTKEQLKEILDYIKDLEV